MIFLLALALITSCRSHKELQQDKSLAADSIARSEHHRTIAVIDSAIRSTSFDFDTLEVSVERPTAYAEKPEVIRLKAVRGRVINQRRVHRDSVEAFNRLDTVAYRQSAAESSTEHTATTRLYNPPDGTAAVIITILVIGGLIYVFYRKR
ncbi:hypothetical protein [Duncaniella muris]|uniref:Uncharacterized protein n=1 Tax=Duncaniella muris TaxID=2094150 RepID=A0A2V1IK58_9BACT|nr:hypothetical protein [Duncaniella muris]PWB00296.1 hypothetical protein C5O23_13215 [Duncaniella muris]